MEEGKSKIEISCGDILALTNEMSNKDVKYARLEMRHEMLVEDHERVKQENESLKQQLEASERARLLAEEKAKKLEEENASVKQELMAVTARLVELTETSGLTDRDIIGKAVKYLLQNHLIISLLQMKAFFDKKVENAKMGLMLRGFVLECVPPQLQPAAFTVLTNMMELPDKPEPPQYNDNRTYDNRTYNANRDFVMSKNVENEVDYVGQGGIGVNIDKPKE